MVNEDLSNFFSLKDLMWKVNVHVFYFEYLSYKCMFGKSQSDNSASTHIGHQIYSLVFIH